MTRKYFSISLWAFALLAQVATTALANQASPSAIARLCDQAAITASRASGVPLPVLRAIMLTETGRTLQGETRPWPWAVNMEGDGRWFDDRATAEAYAKTHFARGARSFDVGCFQINYRWHGEAFPSIVAMFDPEANALYAAGFLLELHDEFGDWTKAAGAYHSRTPKFARRYEARFKTFLAKLEPIDPELPVVDEAPKVVATPNTYPLIQRTTQRGSLASLVPLEGLMSPRLIDIAGQ